MPPVRVPGWTATEESFPPPPHDHPLDGWLIDIADEAPRCPAIYLRRGEHRPGDGRPPGARPLPGGPVSAHHVLRGRPLHGLVRRGRPRDRRGRPRLAPVRLPLHPPPALPPILRRRRPRTGALLCCRLDCHPL